MFDRIEVYDPNGQLTHVEDNRSLEDARLAKKELINQEREIQLAAGLWYMGHFWDTSARARTNLTGIMTGISAGLPLPDNFVWRDNNNNNVPFSPTNLLELGGYMLAYVNMVYNVSWYMKEQIDALATIEEVDAYVFFWPDGNMDGSKPA